MSSTTTTTTAAAAAPVLELNTLRTGGAGSQIQDYGTHEPLVTVPRWKAVSLMVVVSLMTLMSTTLSGILAVALPKVADDIDMAEGLLLWPASVYSLACGCTLLFFGSLSDVVGARWCYLLGSFLSAVWILACGLARTGIQLIIFRALHGIAMSMCMPSSVSILSANFKPGPRRNAAFAALGAAQPTGFFVGLIIGGILTDLLSWRVCFYLVAGINAVIFFASVLSVPRDAKLPGTVLKRFQREADWVGVIIISVALGLLSYVLAVVTIDLSSIRSPVSIFLLVFSIVLFPIFAIWVRTQTKRGAPALIPNSLWGNTIFVSVGGLAFLAWSTVTANQYFLALFFEKVQFLSAFATSLRFLPLVVSGVLANIATGVLVRHVRADFLIAGSVLISAATPLIMALADPAASYWKAAFVATFLSPIAADVVLTIANLTIVSIFPPQMHGLAGAVTNTLAQLGASIGLNISAIFATAITLHSGYSNKSAPEALNLGYRASFWACLGATLAMLIIALSGFRKIGKVGAVKRD